MCPQRSHVSEGKKQRGQEEEENTWAERTFPVLVSPQKPENGYFNRRSIC